MSATHPHAGHLSASQIETFLQCPRKWGLQKLDKEPQPEAKAFADGKLGHLYMEWYLRYGKPPSAAQADPAFHAAVEKDGCTKPGGATCKLARTAQGLMAAIAIPPMHPTVQVEMFWRLNVASALVQGPSGATYSVPVEIIGYMDVFAFDPSHPAPPLVADHKFVGSLQWAKTAEYLATEDVQSTLYALWAMINTGRDTCMLQWNYAEKGKSTAPPPVRALVTAEMIAPRAAQILATARTMQAHYIELPEAIPGPDGKRRRGLSMAPNPQQCASYGGCPYRAICGDLPTPSISDLCTRYL